MTVISTTYSSIDEVWSNNYLSPQIQKKPKKKRTPPQSDPICDLYEMGQNNYTDNDIITFANNYRYENADKSKYQKPMMDESASATPREKSKYVTIENGKYNYDVSDDTDEPQPYSASMFKEQPKQSSQSHHTDLEEPSLSKFADAEEKYVQERPKRIEYYKQYDEDYDNQTQSNFNYLDLMLYIISGVILIFMMEQFVKIGMLLH